MLRSLRVANMTNNKIAAAANRRGAPMSSMKPLSGNWLGVTLGVLEVLGVEVCDPGVAACVWAKAA